ncbi:MAG TPA: hypothetical protein VGJ65_05310 [Albitalea sp.]
MSSFKPSRYLLPLLLSALLCGPVVAQVPSKAYAQELVDRTAPRVPGLLGMTLQAAPDGGSGPVMIASTIGAPTSNIDRGQVNVVLPLLDTTGIVVGSLGLSWQGGPGVSEAARQRDSVALRDQLARRILNARNLSEPYPFVPRVATRTKAQRLVDEIMASERADLRALTLRGFSGGQLMILGSNFGRHGKKAGEEDIKVLNSTEPETGLHAEGRRLNVDLSLRDPAGKPMGTLTVGYAYRNGDDIQALVARALAVRKLIESRASADSLAALDL